ncbi:MAG TPA: exosortase A [Sphingobium sp.]
MTAETLNGRPLNGLLPWPRHLLMLALAGLSLLVLGQSDVAAIIDIWSRTGAFHHCFLIPPILLWLVWQRRGLLARLTPEYSLWGAALAALGGLMWLAGAAGYVAILRQAGLVLSAQGIVIALLGLPVARALIFPIAFSLFLIPVGSEFEPLLQTITARIAVSLLHLSGTPAVLEGVFIETHAGLFRVAEACSGTAFLLAMAAYGALVAAMCFQSLKRRILFMAAGMVAALLTNGVRAFAIMKLASLTSIHNPVVQDHLLFGWILFGVVMLLLMVASARWFDRAPDAPFTDPAVLQGVGRGEAGAWLILPALLVAILLPRLWLMATQEPEGAIPAPPTAPAVAGWQLMPGVYRAEWQPHFAGATWIGQWRYRRAGSAQAVDLAVVVYDRQEEGRELIGFGQGAVAPEGDWALMAAAPSPPQGRGEWLRGPGARTRYAASFYIVGGKVTGSKVEAKLAATLARLTGGRQDAAAILVSTTPHPGAAPERIAGDFIKAAGSVQEMADRARGMR